MNCWNFSASRRDYVIQPVLFRGPQGKSARGSPRELVQQSSNRSCLYFRVEDSMWLVIHSQRRAVHAPLVSPSNVIVTPTQLACTGHGHGIYLCTVTPHNHVWSIMTLVIGLIGTKTTTGIVLCFFQYADSTLGSGFEMTISSQPAIPPTAISVSTVTSQPWSM